MSAVTNERRREAVNGVVGASVGYGTTAGIVAGGATWLVGGAIAFVTAPASERTAAAVGGGLVLTLFACLVGCIIGFLLSLVWALVLGLYAAHSRRAPTEIATRLRGISIALMVLLVLFLYEVITSNAHDVTAGANFFMVCADAIAIVAAERVGKRVANAYLCAYEPQP
jgi:hypothetical protein